LKKLDVICNARPELYEQLFFGLGCIKNIARDRIEKEYAARKITAFHAKA